MPKKKPSGRKQTKRPSRKRAASSSRTRSTDSRTATDKPYLVSVGDVAARLAGHLDEGFTASESDSKGPVKKVSEALGKTLYWLTRVQEGVEQGTVTLTHDGSPVDPIRFLQHSLRVATDLRAAIPLQGKVTDITSDLPVLPPLDPWLGDDVPREPPAVPKPRRRTKPKAQKGTISLCMIAKDEEANIGACLESVKPYVDEMVVVDTGSSDRTAEIAESVGARVFHFPWCDDFAAARNESLAHATCEWIFWMDADDTIEPEHGRKLRELAQHAPSEVYGYIAAVEFTRERSGGRGTTVDHIKLIRNLPEVFFEGRIHEQVLASIRRAGGEIEPSDVDVMHTGYDETPQGQAAKTARDFRLLYYDLKERPDHPFVLFNLGMTLHYHGAHREAIPYLVRSIRLSEPGDSIVRKAYSLWIGSAQALGWRDDAQAVTEEALALYPNDSETLYRAGKFCAELGDDLRAEEHLLRIFETGEESYLKSVDPGVRTYKAYHELGKLYRKMGRSGEAEGVLRKAIEANPLYVPAWESLVDLLVGIGKPNAAEDALEEAEKKGLPAETLSILRGNLCAARSEWEGASRHFGRVPADDPDWERAALGESFALLQMGRLDEAEPILLRILKRDPRSVDARFNLGGLRMDQGRFVDAALEYRRILATHPLYMACREHLARAEEGASEGYVPGSMPPLFPEAKQHGMTSIVIPCWNLVDFTRRCVESILAHTLPGTYELVFIDNGSEDRTPQYLLGEIVPDPRVCDVKVWTNSQNLGVTAAWNQGIRLCDGEYTAVLNNDIEVAPNWLVGLLQALQDDKVALTCPWFTEFTRPHDWPHGSARRQHHTLFGSCYVARTELYSASEAGLFDEGLKLWFNDNELVAKVMAQGMRIAHVQPSYVHHYYSRSIEILPGVGVQVERDRQTFEQKLSTGGRAA